MIARTVHQHNVVINRLRILCLARNNLDVRKVADAFSELRLNLMQAQAADARWIMNPFTWLFIALLSVDAVRELLGMSSVLGMW